MAALCARAFHLFGDRRFERLAAISNGHLYNLRQTTSYYQRRCGAVPARRGRYKSPSANAAARSPSDNPAGYGSIPCIKATWSTTCGFSAEH